MKIFTFNYFESIHIRSLFGVLRQKAKFLVLLLGLMVSMFNSFGQSPIKVSVEFPIGGFEIDGNYSPNTMSPGGGDWFESIIGSGNGVFNFGGDLTTTTIQYGMRNLDPIQSDSDYAYAGGSLADNPTTWKWSKSKATPAKGDIGSAMFFYQKILPLETNGYLLPPINLMVTEQILFVLNFYKRFWTLMMRHSRLENLLLGVKTEGELKETWQFKRNLVEEDPILRQ